MHASDLTFGIEIETIAPTSAIREHGLEIGSYYHGRQVPYLPAGWIAKSDTSIRTTGNGVGCEIVSPVLRGEEGLRQVFEVVKTLEEKGHRVRVVSAPCWEAFERLPAAEQEAVLGKGIRRVSIEAGVSGPWRGVVGDRGIAIGFDRFGASAPASRLAEEFGLTGERVAARILAAL